MTRGGKGGIAVKRVLCTVLVLMMAAAAAPGLGEMATDSLTILNAQFTLMVYLLRTDVCIETAEAAITNMDGYLAQMQADRAALAAAGGDVSAVDGQLTRALEARAEADAFLNGDKSIRYRRAQIEDFCRSDTPDPEAIEMIRRDVFKIYDLAMAKLKRITGITYSTASRSCEATVQRAYANAVTEIERQVAENGLDLTLTPYAPEKTGGDVYAERMALVDNLVNLHLSPDRSPDGY